MRAQAWRLAAVCLLLSPHAAPHHLDLHRLELRPPQSGEVRGRFLLAPQILPVARGGETALLERLENGVALSVDGRPCAPSLALVERWTKSSPSPGHLVDLRCSPSPGKSPQTLEVTWRDASDLLVTYPPTTTSPAVSALLAPGGKVTVVLAGATTPSIRPSPPPPQRPSDAAPAPSPWLRLGFRHVLPDGLDHVLFVVALALESSSRISGLLGKLLAFTLSHGVALYLGALGLLSVSPRLVEPLIALTIVLCAGRAVLRSPSGESRTSTAKALDPLLVSGFGFLHGLGFAGAFGSLDVGARELLRALVMFHVGIEAGQLSILLFVIASLALLARLLGTKGTVYGSTVRGVALVVATFGVGLFLDRVFGA